MEHREPSGIKWIKAGLFILVFFFFLKADFCSAGEIEQKYISDLPGNYSEVFQIESQLFRLRQEFVDLRIIAGWRGVDITSGGVTLSKSEDKDIAVFGEVTGSPGKENWSIDSIIRPIELSCYSWKGLGPHWVTKEKNPWFNVKLPGVCPVNKVVFRQLIYNEWYFPSKFKEVKLTFSKGDPITVKLKDNFSPQQFVFRPRNTSFVRADVLTLHEGKPEFKAEKGLSEFEIYLTTPGNRYRAKGYFVTHDIWPPGLSSWGQFNTYQELNGAKIIWEYSLNSGRTWKDVPQSGDLSGVSVSAKRIRFRATLSRTDSTKSPGVKGFELTWRTSGENLPAALNPNTCKLRIRDGKFFTKDEESIGLFGMCTFPTMYAWAFDQDDSYKKDILYLSNYGFNALRVMLPMHLFLPAPDVLPHDPGYKEILQKHGFKTEFIPWLDRFIDYCGKHGIYTILDIHTFPVKEDYSWLSTPITWAGEKRGSECEKAISKEMPKVWGWLAKHYKGNPYIAGFEIPFNEPNSSWINDNPDILYKLLEDCTEAIKREDHERLIFMEGANFGSLHDFDLIPSSSCWEVPEGIEGTFPHEYLGMHSPTSTSFDAWLPNWTSWFTAPGNLIMVGEWGVVVRLEDVGKNQVDPAKIENGKKLIDASLASWYSMGVEGVFYLGWNKGLYNCLNEYFGHQIPEILTPIYKFMPLWKKGTSGRKAEVAIVSSSSAGVRGNYGAKSSLYSISERLLDLHVTPWDVLFDESVLEHPEWLNRYRVAILLEEGLKNREQIEKVVSMRGLPCLKIKAAWPDTDMGIKKFLLKNGIKVNTKTAENILIGYGEGGFVIYERKGRAGSYHIYPALKREGKLKIIDVETSAVMDEGDGKEIFEEGFSIELGKNEARVYLVTEQKIK